jgi:hypothetical protein
VSRSKASKFIFLKERHPNAYNLKTEKLRRRNVTIGNYLQSRLYFEPIEERVRKTIVFKTHVLNAAQRFLDKVRPAAWEGKDFTRVVIHVRRTDYYWGYARTHFGYQPTDPEYIARAMIYFRSCYDRIQFIVCTDDIGWCRRHIKGPDVVFSTKLSSGQDLALASLCDHAVITVGAFGIFIAWFANGVTIRPQKLYKPNMLIERWLSNATHYFPAATVAL